MVRTWWHKLFSPGQSGVPRGDRRARVRQPRMQKPWLEALEQRCLLSYQITDLGTLPGGTQSLAFGLNNSGQVVGDSTFAGSPFSHAFLWDATNGMQDLGTLPGDSHSRAQGINDFGQVVGISYTDFSAPHAFLWDAVNGMQALGTLPGDSGSSAFGINNSGQVVGHSFLAGTGVFHAFLWDATNGMQALGTLPGDSSSTAYGINDSGQVVGKSVGFGTHAFLWDAVHGMQDLGTLTPGRGAYATGINSNAQVIGASEVYCPIVNDYFYEPFVWQNGTMSHLNDLIPPDSGWEPLAVANAINNGGQIVGEAVHIGFGARAYLLTPDSSPRTAPAGTVHFISDDAQAVLLAGYTVTAADAGVHTVSVTLATLGDQTLTVTDTADATRIGGATVPVTSDAAAPAGRVASLTLTSAVAAPRAEVSALERALASLSSHHWSHPGPGDAPAWRDLFGSEDPVGG